MKVYILIYKEDTGGCYETRVSPYSSRDPAREEMESAYAEKLQEISFDVSEQSDGHRCGCTNQSACIEDGMDYYSWTVEEHELRDLFVK
jgi:hypothetical protein